MADEHPLHKPGFKLPWWGWGIVGVGGLLAVVLVTAKPAAAAGTPYGYKAKQGARGSAVVQDLLDAINNLTGLTITVPGVTPGGLPGSAPAGSTTAPTPSPTAPSWTTPTSESLFQFTLGPSTTVQGPPPGSQSPSPPPPGGVPPLIGRGVSKGGYSSSHTTQGRAMHRTNVSGLKDGR